LKALVEIKQLRRVLEEQFTRGEGGKTTPRPRRQAKGDVITTPHDPEVRYGYKGGQGWVGYKLQMTETADEGPQFITDVEVVPAMRQDNQCLAAIQNRLIKRGIPPGKQYVDQAYMSGRHIADSLSRSIDLRGYVREGNLSKPDGFRLRDFKIDIEQRQVICPAGMKQAKWVRGNQPQTVGSLLIPVCLGPKPSSVRNCGSNGLSSSTESEYDALPVQPQTCPTESARNRLELCEFPLPPVAPLTKPAHLWYNRRSRTAPEQPQPAGHQPSRQSCTMARCFERPSGCLPRSARWP
jgi:hypothetical protein